MLLALLYGSRARSTHQFTFVKVHLGTFITLPIASEVRFFAFETTIVSISIHRKAGRIVIEEGSLLSNLFTLVQTFVAKAHQGFLLDILEEMHKLCDFLTKGIVLDILLAQRTAAKTKRYSRTIPLAAHVHLNTLKVEDVATTQTNRRGRSNGFRKTNTTVVISFLFDNRVLYTGLLETRKTLFFTIDSSTCMPTWVCSLAAELELLGALTRLTARDRRGAAGGS
mmetsp:Transcript_33812/g.84862  ORF Transcript_33812/g.84862 Transcript_33812/m.84862 type:complete len:225 (+) Transcript_33812:3-677(+)